MKLSVVSSLVCSTLFFAGMLSAAPTLQSADDIEQQIEQSLEVNDPSLPCNIYPICPESQPEPPVEVQQMNDPMPGRCNDFPMCDPI